MPLLFGILPSQLQLLPTVSELTLLCNVETSRDLAMYHNTNVRLQTSTHVFAQLLRQLCSHNRPSPGAYFRTQNKTGRSLTGASVRMRPMSPVLTSILTPARPCSTSAPAIALWKARQAAIGSAVATSIRFSAALDAEYHAEPQAVRNCVDGRYAQTRSRCEFFMDDLRLTCK